MQVQRSIPILIQEDQDLKQNLVVFTSVKNQLSPICYNNGKPLPALALHRAAYHLVKGQVGSQQTNSAIRLVAAAYVSARSNKHKLTRPFVFKKPSCLFLIGPGGKDASFRRSGKLSIKTVGGRKKLDYKIPPKFEETFQSAVSYDSIIITDAGHRLSAYLTVTVEVPDPKSISPVGIDLNQTNAVVAADINGDIFFETGLETRIKNKRTGKTIRRLKKKLAVNKTENKDTKSIVRILKRLSQRRSNRTKDFARCVAKKLCSWVSPDAVLVFENLKFKPQKKFDGKTKATHRKLSGWPRGLIRQAMTNRAQLVGLGLAEINPYLTSQTCNKCGLIGNRNRHLFTCSCGNVVHSDINASLNIRNKFTNLRVSGVRSITPEAMNSMASPPA